jgi:hypothetical protein
METCAIVSRAAFNEDPSHSVEMRRANGILRNNLYRGVMIYGRFRKTFYPKTCKRIQRPIP